MNPGTILRNGTPSWWIELEAKDLRGLRFDFGENDVENRNKLHDLIQKLAFENFDGLFCFKNPTSGHKTGHKWYTYDVKEEFKRMTSSLGADCQWKITSENEKFKICETYPPLLIGMVHLKLCFNPYWQISGTFLRPFYWKTHPSKNHETHDS